MIAMQLGAVATIDHAAVADPRADGLGPVPQT